MRDYKFNPATARRVEVPSIFMRRVLMITEGKKQNRSRNNWKPWTTEDLATAVSMYLSGYKMCEVARDPEVRRTQSIVTTRVNQVLRGHRRIATAVHLANRANNILGDELVEFPETEESTPNFQ